MGRAGGDGDARRQGGHCESGGSRAGRCGDAWKRATMCPPICVLFHLASLKIEQATLTGGIGAGREGRKCRAGSGYAAGRTRQHGVCGHQCDIWPGDRALWPASAWRRRSAKIAGATQRSRRQRNAAAKANERTLEGAVDRSAGGGGGDICRRAAGPAVQPWICSLWRSAWRWRRFRKGWRPS